MALDHLLGAGDQVSQVPGRDLVRIRWHVGAEDVGHLVVAFLLVSSLSTPLLGCDPDFLGGLCFYERTACSFLGDLICHKL